MKRSLRPTLPMRCILFTFIIFILGCQHDNSLVGDVKPPDFDYGTDVVALGEWNFDKAHSNVRWETMYLGASALLNGRFNEFALEELEFYADRPEDCKLVGSVVLSTVNTGEPGRDGGCLQETFGTSVNDEARLTSTKFEYDGAGGYDVTANMVFHGFTNQVLIKLQYVGSTFFDVDSGLFGTPFTVAGFTGTFEINAKSQFGIESTSIADRVVIRCNVQLKKPG